MDNSFFQILFWIFIIAIILSSLLSKKPRGTQKKEEGQIPVPRDEDPRYAKNIESYNEEEKEINVEIKDEITNLFKSENENKIPPPIKETKIETYNRESSKPVEQKIPDEYFGWPGTPKQQPAQIIVKDVEKIASEVKQMDSKIEKEAKAFEKYLGKEEMMGPMMSSLKEKIKSPQTLKEYVVISEIIGKPVGMKNRHDYLHR